MVVVVELELLEELEVVVDDVWAEEVDDELVVLPWLYTLVVVVVEVEDELDVGTEELVVLLLVVELEDEVVVGTQVVVVEEDVAIAVVVVLGVVVVV